MEVLNKPGKAKELAKMAADDGLKVLNGNSSDGIYYAEAKAIINVLEANKASWDMYHDSKWEFPYY